MYIIMGWFILGTWEQHIVFVKSSQNIAGFANGVQCHFCSSLFLNFQKCQHFHK